eukprot:scaffold3628_cov75-Skeletonema_marinoi.AAC.1
MPNSECITAVQCRRRRPSWSLIGEGQAIKRGFFRIVSHTVAVGGGKQANSLHLSRRPFPPVVGVPQHIIVTG